MKNSRASLSVRLGVLGILVLVWGLAMFGPGLASAQDSSSRASIGQDLVVQQGEVVQGNASVTNANLTVRGEVQGDAVVVKGNADVQGKVDGNITVTGGNLTLGPKASVGGNVLVGGDVALAAGCSIGGNVAYLGAINRAPGARVGGEVVRAPSISFGEMDNVIPGGMHNGAPWSVYSPFARTAAFIAMGVFGLVLLIIGAIMAMVAPSRISISTATLETEPGPSIVVGFIVALLFFPVVAIATMVLVITVIGAILVPILAGLALLYGLVVIGLWLGRRLYDPTQHATNYQVPPLLFDVLLGMAVVLGSTLIPAAFVPAPATVLLLILLYLVSCLGLGAALLSRFGTLTPPRRAARYPVPATGVPPYSTAAPAYYAPPVPSGPSITTPLGARPPLPGEQPVGSGTRPE